MTATFDDLELPILKALADLEDPGTSDLVGITDNLLATTLNFDAGRVRLAMRRLINANFIAATQFKEHLGDGSTVNKFLNIELLERGLRAAGTWPNS